MPTLILVRHGESASVGTNRFGGWSDTHLTDKGKLEARRAGSLISEFGFKPTIVYTSRLTRSIQTANIALEASDRLYIDMVHSWRLNERHYGSLQGRLKSEVLKEVGREKFMEWRRSWDNPPPPATTPVAQPDPRYADIPAGEMPNGESLKMVCDRTVPFYSDVIARGLQQHQTVLVVAHGSSLRALIRSISSLGNDEAAQVEVPTGIPFVYELDSNLRPLKERYYLDPDLALKYADEFAKPVLS